MSEWGSPVAVLLASLLLTYFACLRPMRQGNCAMSLRWPARTRPPRRNSTYDAELAQLRAEVEELKAAEVVRPSPVPLGR